MRACTRRCKERELWSATRREEGKRCLFQVCLQRLSRTGADRHHEEEARKTKGKQRTRERPVRTECLAETQNRVKTKATYHGPVSRDQSSFCTQLATAKRSTAEKQRTTDDTRERAGAGPVSEERDEREKAPKPCPFPPLQLWKETRE